MTAMEWPLDSLSRSLGSLLPGWRVESVPQIDSTNSELLRRARAGQTRPSLLVADAQTGGRGRMGRAWQSAPEAPGTTLAFSVGLNLDPGDWSGLSLAVGLALAESLHPDIRIKWPNDLWWQGRKLAGILIETAGPANVRGRFVVIGVGINILPIVSVPGAGAAPEAEAFSTPPAWTTAIDPALNAPATLARVAAPLLQAVLAFERAGFAPLASRFNALDAFAGIEVRLTDGTEGRACGVASNGAFRVQTVDGVREIFSAEVSVRPRSGA